MSRGLVEEAIVLTAQLPASVLDNPIHPSTPAGSKVRRSEPPVIIVKMFAKMTALAAVVAAGLLVGCGTSTPGPDGSKAETMSGVSPSGYPGGKPKDAESPALASSSEQDNSNPGPKVPVEEPIKPVSK